MNIIMNLVNFILHIDTHLVQLVSTYGVITYAIIFGIIFIETGLVLTPFLPGDSLLFATGALAALGSFNVWLILPLMILAAILGDTSNYWIGHFFGEKMIANPKIPIKKEHIEKTNAFFEKYGGKTIILARFVPIVRTFAPFVAGVGKMHYGKFISYNIIGGIAWVSIFILAGYFFGNMESIKENFSIVVMAIILISVIPMVFEAVKHKLKK
ncbi:MAG: DedA family protein [Microgenomates group bacterium]